MRRDILREAYRKAERISQQTESGKQSDKPCLLVVSPGDLLKRLMTENHKNIYDVAEQSDMDIDLIVGILTNNMLIDNLHATLLHRTFPMTPSDYWLYIQEQYRRNLRI